MDYQQAVDYIESPALPRGRYGLERLKQALELLGNPQHKVRFVHVAGTNGKGSCAAMLASVLKEAGYPYRAVHLPSSAALQRADAGGRGGHLGR